MSSSDSSHTVTQHPLQDVDLSVSNENIAHSSGNPNAMETTTKNVNKENWVKFDDDVNEGILGTTTTNAANNNNNNTNSSSNNHSIHNDNESRMNASNAADVGIAPTPTNRLTPSPIPPPNNPKRISAGAAAAAGAISRPRTPTQQAESGSSQQLHAIQLDAPTQRPTVPLSIPDVAAPAVLTTESTHVDLNAPAKTPPTHQQNLQHHQHHQKPTSSAPANNLTSSNNVAPTVNNNNNTHHNQQVPHHSNHANKHGPVSSSASTATSPSTSAVANNVAIPVESQPPMRTIELSTGRIREGFANGDVIVTLLPANTKFPWVTPAIFRPELVPEELMAQGLTLTVEEYVHAMETLVNDYRFTMYNICYKRILVCWILFAFTVLLTLLFSGLQGVALFSLGVGWLFLNAAAIFLCMWVKLRLARGLEKCLARVNKQLIKHKILLILDDRGRISCHKVNLCFLYFDSGPCVNFLNEFLEHTEQNGGENIKAGWESKLDIDLNDIVIQGSTPVRVSRKQERGVQVFLRYASRWGREAIRGLVDVTPLEPGRHCGQFQCPCQYIKDHLQCKPRGYPCSCVAYGSNPHYQDPYY
ncbi:rhoGEF domain-containing protein gxcI isoform X4 [Stomoxys calcitrans]|uniref:rhoGEF domain-containing protein gxcI isoform X3 n=1 Tax=Stomoxys calcitrans TaxID=35570 RepID=UPI0027E251C3|nr:rhoGEF domain-containing protein gxcI isoform X3 [Stomoxys calcitrans]XP_059220786.1 rhoGEF domain-containing protein gxcI isoform X4 [Stomoxys calcitrans]